MRNNGIVYDTSCANVAYYWPYTLDVMPMAHCDIGAAAELSFPGKYRNNPKY